MCWSLGYGAEMRVHQWKIREVKGEKWEVGGGRREKLPRISRTSAKRKGTLALEVEALDDKSICLICLGTIF